MLVSFVILVVCWGLVFFFKKRLGKSDGDMGANFLWFGFLLFTAGGTFTWVIVLVIGFFT